jgi:hypothetical protein
MLFGFGYILELLIRNQFFSMDQLKIIVDCEKLHVTDEEIIVAIKMTTGYNFITDLSVCEMLI